MTFNKNNIYQYIVDVHNYDENTKKLIKNILEYVAYQEESVNGYIDTLYCLFKDIGITEEDLECGLEYYV